MEVAAGGPGAVPGPAQHGVRAESDPSVPVTTIR